MTREPDLASRQERERSFHDRWAESVDLHELDPVRMARCPTTPETSYAFAALSPIDGRRVLDLGCGYGETAVWLALGYARVDAADIAPKMVEISSRLAASYDVADRIRFHVSPGETLPFEDGAFDRVFGHDVLHHMDLERARREILRVLKPGGRAVFVEPLGHNPIINLFRDLSPETRTPDEVPLRFRDFRRLREGFRQFRHREFQLTTLSLFLWFYFIERANPNEVRYWKKIIVEADRYRRAFAVLDGLDRALMTLLPPLRRLCRMTVLVLDK